MVAPPQGLICPNPTGTTPKFQENLGRANNKNALAKAQESRGSIHAIFCAGRYKVASHLIEEWPSLVGHLLWEQGVAGSSPVSSTIRRYLFHKGWGITLAEGQ